MDARLTNLNLKMFVRDIKSPWSTWANLGAKGGECKHLAPCLLPVLQASLDMSRPEHPKMVHCLENLVALTKAIDQCDLFLTSEEFNTFFNLAKGFVESYTWLNAHFHEAGRPLFHIVNKSHSFLHWAWEARYISPSVHACWMGEDFVGRMAKVAHSISFGSKTQKLSMRLMPKYKALMHLTLKKVIGPDTHESLSDSEDESLPTAD